MQTNDLFIVFLLIVLYCTYYLIRIDLDKKKIRRTMVNLQQYKSMSEVFKRAESLLRSKQLTCEELEELDELKAIIQNYKKKFYLKS